MKKAILVFAAVLSSALTYAQNKNVVSAINYMRYYEQDKKCEDLNSAKTYIDQAAEHADTKESAKMWYNRGKIYHIFVETKDEKCKGSAPDALFEAANSYMNCLKLDEKKIYTDEVKQRLGVTAIQLVNKGVGEYQAKNYDVALKMFNQAININKTFFNKTDTLAMYNTARVAEDTKNYELARQMYRNLIDAKFGGQKEGPKLYFWLAYTFKNQNDMNGYLASIQEGRKAFPNNKDLILEEINYYLSSGKDKEALVNLEEAVQKDPTNPTLYFALGMINDKLNNTEKAETAYMKAIELNPKYFDAYFNLGALYFNKGVKVSDAANDIKDNKVYQKEMSKADEFFKKSVPYLEKAEEINTEDKDTYKALLTNLHKLYLMTEQPDKAKAIKEKLKN